MKILLDRLKSIHFKTKIPVILITSTNYIEYVFLMNKKNEDQLLSFLNNNVLYLKIHSIKNKLLNNTVVYFKTSKKNMNDDDLEYYNFKKIIKISLIIKDKLCEYFVVFNKFKYFENDNNKLYFLRNSFNDIDYSKIIRTFTQNSLQYKENDKMIKKYNKFYCMSTIYSYNYIKGEKGNKELVPEKTYVYNKLSVKNIAKLIDIYYDSIDYNLCIKNFIKDDKYWKKDKSKIYLYYLFKEYKKQNYLNWLSIDIKRHICNFM